MIKEFLISNWYYLAPLALGLINIFIVLLRKNKIVQKDTIFEQLLEILPTMIRSAEKEGISGADKKTAVMTYALTWLNKMTGEDSQKYYDRISNAIESILNTPEKKGVNDEK